MCYARLTFLIILLPAITISSTIIDPATLSHPRKVFGPVELLQAATLWKPALIVLIAAVPQANAASWAVEATTTT